MPEFEPDQAEDTGSVTKSGSGKDHKSGDADSDTDTDADTDTDTDIDTDIDTDTDGDSDSDSNSELGGDSDTRTDTGTSAGTDTSGDDTSSESDTSTGTGTDTGSDTDTGPAEGKLVITFYEKWNHSSDYESHRLLVGPASSNPNPENTAQWTEIADKNAMKNPELVGNDDTWKLGYVADISKLKGNKIRVAFHYKGASADSWYVDQVCIGSIPQSEATAPGECIFEEKFPRASMSNPELPEGWSSVAGSSNKSEDGWGMSTLSNYPSSSLNSLSATIDATENDATLSDWYLVSPAIDLSVK